MVANEACVKKGDTIIFNVDEYRDGSIDQFDGHVLSASDQGVSVVYLSGYKSRNDDISWSDVIAKLDKRKPYIKLKRAPFSGHFVEYDLIGES
jgi:hypothetical protein